MPTALNFSISLSFLGQFNWVDTSFSCFLSIFTVLGLKLILCFLSFSFHLFFLILISVLTSTFIMFYLLSCVISCRISSVQSLSHVQLFVTPWTAARQASLSITNSWSLLRLLSIESVRPSNHLILYRPLLLPSIVPSIRVFSNVSCSHQVAKVLEFQLQHQSFQWTSRTDPL